ncbi:MAG: hypothetical protein QOH35_3062 [Acidobacteriaceae bacterium]|nr:hypothetical protein [Acidobacteriaceae bacterium]
MFDGAKPRDLQFNGPLLEMFFDRASPIGAKPAVIVSMGRSSLGAPT